MTWSGPTFTIEAAMDWSPPGYKRDEAPEAVLIRGRAEQTRPGRGFDYPVVTISEHHPGKQPIFRKLSVGLKHASIVSHSEEDDPELGEDTEGAVVEDKVECVRVQGRHYPPAGRTDSSEEKDRKRGILAMRTFERSSGLPYQPLQDETYDGPQTGWTGRYLAEPLLGIVSCGPFEITPDTISYATSTRVNAGGGIRLEVGELVIPEESDSFPNGTINSDAPGGVFIWDTGVGPTDVVLQQRLPPEGRGSTSPVVTLHYLDDPPRIAYSIVQPRTEADGTEFYSGIGVEMSPDDLPNVTVGGSRGTPLNLQAPLPSPEEHRFSVVRTTGQTQVIPVPLYGDESVSPSCVVGENAKPQFNIPEPALGITITLGEIHMGGVCLDLPTGVFNLPNHGINIEPTANGMGVVVTEGGNRVMSLTVKSA